MKRNLKLLLTVIVVAISTTYACTNKSQGNSKDSTVSTEISQELKDEHTSKNSLDWSGIYSGVLPCADCEGIETELIINEDGTYKLTTSYMGVKDSMSETIEGKFVWQEDGNSIKLEGIAEGSRSPFFKIEENSVRYLDMEGNKIEGELENFYVLAKEGNFTVEDKKWQLIELNGKAIENSNPENYYLIFDSKERVAHTKVNCNLINVSYKIKKELSINFKQSMMTLMACPDGNIEQEYMEVLNTVDNLSTDGETLTLNKARMAPLAKFKLVIEE